MSAPWVVRLGQGTDVPGCPPPPAGPWRGWDAAETAMARWRERAGCLAGTWEAASGSVLVSYGTRREAREADLGDIGQPIQVGVRP